MSGLLDRILDRSISRQKSQKSGMLSTVPESTGEKKVSLDGPDGNIFLCVFSCDLNSDIESQSRLWIGKQNDGLLTGVAATGQDFIGQFEGGERWGYGTQYLNRDEMEVYLNEVAGKQVSKEFLMVTENVRYAEMKSEPFQERVKVCGRWERNNLSESSPLLVTSNIPSSTNFFLVIDLKRKLKMIRTVSKSNIFNTLWVSEKVRSSNKRDDPKKSILFKYQNDGQLAYLTIDQTDSKSRYGQLELLTTGYLYFGMWLEGKKHGNGREKLSNGDVYVGQFKDDLKDGTGCIIFNYGSNYMGQFSKGKRSGLGKLTLGELEFYGSWSQGVKNGPGITLNKLTYIASLQYWNMGNPSNASFECMIIDGKIIVSETQGVKGSDINIPYDKFTEEIAEDVLNRCINAFARFNAELEKIGSEISARKEEFPKLDFEKVISELLNSQKSIQEKQKWIENTYYSLFKEFQLNLEMKDWHEISNIPDCFSDLKKGLISNLKERFPDWRSQMLTWIPAKTDPKDSIFSVSKSDNSSSIHLSTKTNKANITAKSYVGQGKKENHPVIQHCRTQRHLRQPLNSQHCESQSSISRTDRIDNQSASYCYTEESTPVVNAQFSSRVGSKASVMPDRESFPDVVSDVSAGSRREVDWGCGQSSRGGDQRVSLDEERGGVRSTGQEVSQREVDCSIGEITLRKENSGYQQAECQEGSENQMEEGQIVQPTLEISTFSITRAINGNSVEKHFLRVESLLESQKKLKSDQNLEINPEKNFRVVFNSSEDQNQTFSPKFHNTEDKKLEDHPKSNFMESNSYITSEDNIEQIVINRSISSKGINLNGTNIAFNTQSNQIKEQSHESDFQTLSFRGDLNFNQSSTEDKQDDQTSQNPDVSQIIKQKESRNIDYLCELLLNFNTKAGKRRESYSFGDRLTASFKIDQFSNKSSLTQGMASVNQSQMQSLFKLSSEHHSEQNELSSFLVADDLDQAFNIGFTGSYWITRYSIYSVCGSGVEISISGKRRKTTCVHSC